MKKNTSDKKIIVLASISALLFIMIGAFLLVRNIDYKSNGIKTYAVITRIETDYSPTDESTNHYVYVRFEAEGKIVEGELGAYTSSMREGFPYDTCRATPKISCTEKQCFFRAFYALSRAAF